MFRFLQLLVCFFAVASAYELPMSRRAMLARVAAAAPLAAVAGPALADADNRMYTLVPRAPIDQVKVKDGEPVKAVGLGLKVDPVWGSAVKDGAILSASEAAAYSKDSRGIKVCANRKPASACFRGRVLH